MNYRFTIIYLLIISSLYSSLVKIHDAEIVAKNLYFARSHEDIPKELIISSVEVIKEESEDLFYIFHLDPHGFVMISADDRTAPILAYSFDNPFPLEDIPPNVSWVLGKYKKNILNRIRSNQPVMPEVQIQWDKFLYGKGLSRFQDDFVEPLISATFNLIK